jgi:cysteine synthase
VPPQWDPQLADDIITVSDAEVEEQTRLLAEKEGLYVGFSSGGNVCAAVKLLSSGRLKEDAVVVTVLCDTAYKYTTL